MKQINNGFMPYYYLSVAGEVFNTEKNKKLKVDKNYSISLKTTEGSYKKTTIKKLYKLVYDKVFCIDNIKDLDNEHWKEIEGTEGRYFISDKGRCKSLTGYEAIILKPTRNNGYERVDIVIDGKRYTKLIHRLVAAAFLPLPDNIDYVLHHIDFHRFENSANNIIWLSPAQHRKIHKERRTEQQKNDR